MSSRLHRWLLIAASAFLFVGCEGDDGSNGTNGANGADGQDAVDTGTISVAGYIQWRPCGRRNSNYRTSYRQCRH